MPERIPYAPAFNQYYADAGFAFMNGLTMDLAFIQNVPEIAEDEPKEGDSGGIIAESARSEVCRIRTAPSAAITLAFDILSEAAVDKRARKSSIRRRINEIIQMLDVNEAEADGA